MSVYEILEPNLIFNGLGLQQLYQIRINMAKTRALSLYFPGLYVEQRSDSLAR
jgi:hypothetical protein